MKYVFFNTSTGAYLEGMGASRNDAARCLGIVIVPRDVALQHPWTLVGIWDREECVWRDDAPARAWAETIRPDLMASVRKALTEANRINDLLNDPEGDGSGDDAQAPDGDSYCSLWDAIEPLFDLCGIHAGTDYEGRAAMAKAKQEAKQEAEAAIVDDIPHVFRIEAGCAEHHTAMRPGFYAQFNRDMDSGVIYGPFATKADASNAKRSG